MENGVDWLAFRSLLVLSILRKLIWDLQSSSLDQNLLVYNSDKQKQILIELEIIFNFNLFS